ncbi:putative nuclease HARBI1 [Mercenaria mercenaria]|uniref:putative nuclease HARBI1 n=1 Tax=Mercenaria mercenaria TaxID=6596 RepID=UPI00234EADCA|nr:putative nuclease HARBI1 [Mercenaria mercenaria]
MSGNTVSIIIREVCQAIIDEFMAEVVQTPTTQEQRLAVAETFETRWQLPHTLGALDGKHVAIECPPGGGSVFYNYKKFHSIVMMAFADADYKFLWVDVGEPGGTLDRLIWNACELKQYVEEGLMDIPHAAPQDDRPLPYWFIGDNAFGMKTWLLKPFAKRGLTGEERI